MRPIVVVLVLAVSSVVAGEESREAEEKPWPQKGDTVYVSATLVLESGTPFETLLSDVPACVPLRVVKTKDQALQVKPPNSGIWKIRLVGPWSGHLHASRKECSGAFGDEGQPTIIRRSWSHQIIPE
jgi:hypothetical protein